MDMVPRMNLLYNEQPKRQMSGTRTGAVIMLYNSSEIPKVICIKYETGS